MREVYVNIGSVEKAKGLNLSLIHIWYYEKERSAGPLFSPKKSAIIAIHNQIF